jgi:chemotaxis protein methyltransferase CheR
MLMVTMRALQQLASLLLERAGLKITPDGYHSLRLALSTRMPLMGLVDSEEYIRRLRDDQDELRALLPLVTVGHTEFFRDPKQFQALEKRILPETLHRARREFRKVSIWSAGCATGEEPYSLAMVLVELGALSVEVDLWATDLNLAAVESARRGRFSTRRLQGMSADRRMRFFRPVHEGYEVSPILKEYIRFDGQNLAVPVFEKVQSESLDLILCRNVIIYFDLPTIRELMDRFLTALRPGGLLLLGYSESLFKVYDRFDMVEVEGSFVYRRPINPLERRPGVQQLTYTQPPVLGPGLTVPGTPVSTDTEPGMLPATEALQKMVEDPATEALRRSLAVPGGTTPPHFTAEAGAEMTKAPAEEARKPAGKTRPLPDVPLGVPPGERLNNAVRMMEQGDFMSAVSTVEHLLTDEPNHLDALLTLGNLHSLMGRTEKAREVFAQAIDYEPLCVEARVFGGLAALQAGHLQEARSELGKALFLEPTLALGHYLVAQVYERLKEHEAARRSYRNAISQLRFVQRPLAGHYPELPDSAESISNAARYALAALEEVPQPS